MTETLPRLLALQTCDQRIREALQTLERLRASLAARKEQAFAAARDQHVGHDAMAKAAQAREAFAAQRDQIKDQVREKKRSAQRRRAEEAKASVQREIALLEARKAAIEQELRTLETQITEGTAALHGAEEVAPTQAEVRQHATAALLDQIAAAKDVLRTAQEERSALTSGIPPFVLYEYERVFAHRGGVAVVAITHETCQGCHLRVPAHICLGLLRHPRLTFCPHCQRIVFVSQDNAVVPSSPDLPSANGHQPRRLQRRTRGAARASKALVALAASQPPSTSA